MKKTKLYVLWNEYGESICVDGHTCTKEDIIKELRLSKKDEDIPAKKLRRLYLKEIYDSHDEQYISHITKDKKDRPVTVWYYDDEDILDVHYALKQDGTVFR